MRKVIQKRKVKVIKKEIVEYYCDYCVERFKLREKKRTYFNSETKKTTHYHKKCDILRGLTSLRDYV